jgi:serine/threonine protein kinase
MIWLWSTLRGLRGIHGTETFTRLGHGTFATVYKGLQRATGNFFAIKVIKTKLDTSNKMVERETDILRELRHVWQLTLASLILIHSLC